MKLHGIMHLKEKVKAVAPPQLIKLWSLSKELKREYDLTPQKRQLFGSDIEMVPPLRLMHDGLQNYQIFKDNGEEHFRYFTELCGLKPHHAVLDVGCGIARKALPLVHYLNSSGRYEGFDIVPSGINWCKQRISSRYPQFNFQLVDVYSKHYNPAGSISPMEFKFPYSDNQFDLVVLGSVFTHMIPEHIVHYMEEIARVLKPGGKAFISYLLLNDEVRSLFSQGKAYQTKFPWRNCLVLSPADPEHLIAHQESDIIETYRHVNLHIEQIHYGSWCGRDQFISHQDLIISTK